MVKILLVEDNATIRDMLTRRLAKRRFAVVCAADGQAACSLAEAERPDLILLDLHLPVVDGWETARRLKTAAATRAIPIIALTADAMAGDRDKALEAGCDDYETKPIDLDSLLSKIGKLVPAGDRA
jgi:CheY-like chemotaxis protein